MWSAGFDALNNFQVGCQGLVKTAERFDPRKGRFGAYAPWWIRRAIQRCIQDQSSSVRIPVRAPHLLWFISDLSDFCIVWLHVSDSVSPEHFSESSEKKKKKIFICLLTLATSRKGLFSPP